MKYIKIGMILCVMLSFFHSKLRGQDSTTIVIEAIVSSEDGKPIADASVYGGEGTIVKYSDASGNVVIEVLSNTILYVKANGYIAQTFTASTSIKKFILIEDDGTQKVRVAFSSVDKKDLGGAITVVNPEEYINYDYSQNTSTSIYGRAAGLMGGSNIWGMSDMLVMIDGVPRNMSDIMIDEIDQITVLKGVNAVALYGSHAAKGVVLITSKRGEAFNRKINIRASAGSASPIILPKYLGSSDYMTLYNEARENDGLAPSFSEEIITNYRDGNSYKYPSIDYYSSEYLKDQFYTSNLATEFSGGNNNARFYSNIGWSSSSSLLKVGEANKNKSNRFNIRGNIDLKINSFITSNIDVSIVLGDSRSGVSDYWWSASTLLPHKYTPLLPIDKISANADSALILAKGSKNVVDGNYLLGGSQETMTNTFADLYAGGYYRIISRNLQIANGINVDLAKITNGLSFNTKIYTDYANAYLQSITNTYAVYAPTWGTGASADSIVGLTKFNSDSRSGTQNVSASAQKRTLGMSAQFNYVKTLNEKHNISAILLGSATSINQNGVFQASNNTNMGLQLAYNFDHKYWVDFSGAFVNSTKLPAGNRTAFSPTVGLGWLLSSEGFLSEVDAIDHLKISASAGILNTDLEFYGYYLYDNIFSSQDWFSWYDATYSSRATTSNYGANPKLGFAQRKEVNLTIEGVFFNKLLTVQTSLFLNQMDKLPTQQFTKYPEYMSDFVPYSNYNCNQYSGLDLMVNLNKKMGEVDLNLGVNATYYNSKVIKREELFADAYMLRTGKPVDAIFGLVSDGFFDDETEISNSAAQAFGDVMPGDIKYVDQNGDKIINERDEVMIGRWSAPLFCALNFSVSYKNIVLFVQGAGILGGDGMKSGNYYWVDGDDKYSEVVLDRWTEETKATATYPRLSSQTNNNNYRYSDFWMISTDRFDITKAQLTYNLPDQVLRKSKVIREFSVFANGVNLISFSKNRDVMNLSVGSSPQCRYFNLGVSMKF